MIYELTCPACGVTIDAPDLAELFGASRAHTLDAHNYDVPFDHVQSMAVRADNQTGDPS